MFDFRQMLSMVKSATVQKGMSAVAVIQVALIMILKEKWNKEGNFLFKLLFPEFFPCAHCVKNSSESSCRERGLPPSWTRRENMGHNFPCYWNKRDLNAAKFHSKKTVRFGYHHSSSPSCQKWLSLIGRRFDWKWYWAIRDKPVAVRLNWDKRKMI